MPGKLDGKRAIVTGAASGIGRASVLRFVAEGAVVAAVDINGKGMAETAALVEAEGGRCTTHEASASDEAAMSQIFDQFAGEHGGLDVMIANAGIIGQLVRFPEVTVDDFRRVLDVNLIGPFIAIQGAARLMKEGTGGSIVCTASVAGLRSGAGPTPYSASKAGVINLVQTAANQLSGTGVRVNAICPGLVETGMTKILFDGARAAGKADKIGQLNPQRRAGESEEIAAAALFLASDESSYVNGQALVVDGGLSSTHPFVPGQLF
ncbi:MAG: SDR family NAD(P)-dependent oxidoreductase [Myxococcota bacterium]